MNRYEAITFVVAALLIALVALSPVACTIHRHQLVKDAIDKGANPIGVYCALEAERAGQDPLCASYAATSGK